MASSERERGDRWYWPLWGVAAAFGAYFCMYAFRKPFTAAGYADEALWGVDYKSVLVIAQVLGYTLSKFIGIKVVSELSPRLRGVGILVLIGIAEFALLLFGLIPAPYNFAPLFLNGLPLGMVFGLVLGFLEGRRLTEALTAGLCASFILADGVMKSIGAWLLSLGTPEYWMPFLAGLPFALPLLLCVWMLTKLPQPSASDERERTERVTMNGTARYRFYMRYGLGITLIVGVYLMVTILRSMRADFAPELWRELGAEAAPSIFARSEIFVALGVLVVNGASVLVRDNRTAFFASLGVSLAGILLVAAALVLQGGDSLGAFPFMVLLGLGLYLPYVAIHTTVFERLIAMTRDRGTIGFLMYVADAFGYLGYVAVMLVRGVLTPQENILGFFSTVCWGIVGVSLFSLVGAGAYFAVRRGGEQPAKLAPKPLGTEAA